MSSATERLTTGWEPDVTPTDTLCRAALFNTADRARHQVESLGGRVEADGEVMMTDAGGSNPFLNWSFLLTAPSQDAVERVAAFHSGPFVLISALPTGDLRPFGLELMGHPPFMVRAAGGDGPPVPDGLAVDEVTDEAGLLEYARTLIEGYPMPDIAGQEARFFGAGALGGPSRFWIGRAGGRPVAVAGSHTAHGVVNVEWVATREDARGRGFGAAVTWAAAIGAPALPATLIASDPGRPVYERMGYLAVDRWTMWCRS
jgi:GNAT superfamily N-acetyltransferase